ncbi:MAG: cyclase family protein [Maribacter sp.]
MKTTIHHKKKEYLINLSKPLDISIPITGKKDNVNAWYVDAPMIEPHIDGAFIGSIAEGATTNFYDITFNPHAHGTHTEGVGHISKAHHSVNAHIRTFFFLAEVVTIAPGRLKDDFVITKRQLQNALGDARPEALVIRTIPNTQEKKSKQYSHTNPPYILAETAAYMVELGIMHLLVDLPSVDKEKDEGALSAHKAFWAFDGEIRTAATITEFIFVPNTVRDGSYFLDLQVAPFENDASPSRPVLYKIKGP